MRISQLAWCFGAVVGVAMLSWLPNAQAAQVQKTLRPPVKSPVIGNGSTIFAKDASGLTGGPKTTLGSFGTTTQNANGVNGSSNVLQGQSVFQQNGNDPSKLNNSQFAGSYNGPYPVPYAVPYPQPYPYIPTPYPAQYYPGGYPYVNPMPYYPPYQQAPYPQYPQYPQVSPYYQMGNGFAPNPYASQYYGYPGASPYNSNDFSPYGNPWQGNRPPVVGPVIGQTDGFGMYPPNGMGFGFRGMWN